MSYWETPQTAEQLAAKEPRRPFDELIRELAERTGRPCWRVQWVTGSQAAQSVNAMRHEDARAFLRQRRR